MFPSDVPLVASSDAQQLRHAETFLDRHEGCGQIPLRIRLTTVRSSRPPIDTILYCRGCGAVHQVRLAHGADALHLRWAQARRQPRLADRGIR